MNVTTVSFTFIILCIFCIGSTHNFTAGKRGWFWSWLFKRKCQFNGSEYKKGDVIHETYNPTTNICIRYKCGALGLIKQVVIRNCHVPPTPPPTTATRTTPTRPPTTTPPTTPLVCFHRGSTYPPGTEISSGRTGNHCYFTRCSRDGHVVSGDNFHCGPSSSTTPPPSTTMPSQNLRVLERELEILLKLGRKHHGK